MIVLDAGVVIALLDGRDAHHRAAVALLEEHPPAYLMHPLTLAEVLVGPAGAGEEQSVLDDLLSIGIEETSLGPHAALDLARVRATYRLKMPDTCVLATALHHALPLATFDDRLARVASASGLSVA